jgi:hypothetical protein
MSLAVCTMASMTSPDRTMPFHQLRLGDERRFEGMRKRNFTRRREIRRVQDAGNDRYAVLLGCPHNPHLLLTGRTASGCSRVS